MDKNKVLFLVHLPPPVHGSSLLGKLIVTSVKISAKFESTYVNLLLSSTVSSSGQFSFIKIGRALKTIYETLLSVSFNRPKICYFALSSSGFALYRDFILVIILKLFRIKIVYHLHNKGIKNNQSKTLNKKIYEFLFGGNKVIIGSKLLYKDVEDYFSFDKVYICPNGIAENPNIHLNKKNEIVKILYLSNWIKSKGILDLMASCQILVDSGLDFVLQIAGSEGDLSLQDLILESERLNISSHIEIVGAKFGSEKYQLLKEADIFVLPTYYSNECFPLVILEAMQSELPVVSTFEGGIPDFVENNITGYLVNQRDIRGLSNRLQDLILNPGKRISMGASGRKRYENNFTLSHFEFNILAILEKELKQE